jgi:very-short-patch-repair endonuclease
MRDARLTAKAKEMRREPTEPELRLWLALRAKRFDGVKFRRQKVIGPYVVDFASRTPMLVVEVDGDTHAMRQEHDRARTAFLETQGYRVVRFSNLDVMSNLEGVLATLQRALCTAPLPTLSPEGERAL